MININNNQYRVTFAKLSCKHHPGGEKERGGRREEGERNQEDGQRKEQDKTE